MVQFTDLSSYRIVVCSVALCSISIRHEVSCHIWGMRLPCYTNRARLFVRVNRHSTGHATLLHIPSSCSSSCAHVWLQSCHPACSLVLTRFWIYIYVCMHVCMYVCISIYLSIHIERDTGMIVCVPEASSCHIQRIPSCRASTSPGLGAGGAWG